MQRIDRTRIERLKRKIPQARNFCAFNIFSVIIITVKLVTCYFYFEKIKCKSYIIISKFSRFILLIKRE